MDSKEQAFISRKCPEIFHSIEHTNDIWLPDPFDVESVHRDARDTFERLVEQALDGRVPSGRILVIRGEAGSGKTHLMRAFRNYVHREESAFFAYMQMTTSSQNYERYVLQNLIDSLQQPYHPDEPKTSLQVLSDRLVQMLPRKRADELRGSDSGPEAAPIVHELADRLVDRNDLPPVDPDLIRALLFLQVGRPSVTTKVNKYLRAEVLSEYDRESLGGIAPLHSDDAPLRLAVNLAKLIRTPLNRAFVICMDQLEDMFNLEAARERFPRAMSAVTSLAELPSVVVVVSCLELFYLDMKQYLTTSTIHRLEQDPPPVILSGTRTVEEARLIIARRLNRLWDESGIEADGTIDPFPASFLDHVAGLHTRAILTECLAFRTRAAQSGKIPPVPVGDLDLASKRPEDGTVTALIQAWNDWCTRPQVVPEDESERRELLHRVLPLVTPELGMSDPLKAIREAEPNAIGLHATWMKPTYLAVTETGAQGGGLLRQMEGAVQTAADRTLILVRSDDFSKNPRAKTMKALGKITGQGGRGVVVSDADWRRMVAFCSFHAEHRDQPAYGRFRSSEKPLLKIRAIKEVFYPDNLTVEDDDEQVAVATRSRDRKTSIDWLHSEPPVAASTPAPDQMPSVIPSGPIHLGATQGHRPSAVTLDAADLKRHAAFLGSTGSGKTTAAMMVIEQLLARKIPAILVDRKGDLCGYGLPSVWTAPLDDADQYATRERIRASVNVQLFTPGAPRGRHLAVPIVPPDIHDLSGEERRSAARMAADGLADMMNYGGSQTHKGGRVAIARAISFLGDLDHAPTLESIIALLQEPEEEFIAELQSLAKFCEKTAIDLEILKEGKAELLGAGGELLDVDRLLRPGADGRVPLSIISTKFLGSEADVQFWVAQLLLQINRWLDRNPSTELQGVVMLDEADLYLPATRNPISKKPVEDLLRRARSKGFGVLLATQSPGDLDYKCRDNIVSWFVGLVAQNTALKKLEPMFRDAHADVNRLAAQKVGEFHFIHEGKVRAIKTRMNAVPLPSQVPDEDILQLARGSELGLAG